ncbi:sensor histidine kinase [Nocardioides sp. Soil796]|uniref:sensor histidine kinase n=1 Tax=Nocardioides sp. Soil796 TaxID=1736412 RepID=UPI00070C60BE|nr:ATP-binding protein [Nocardioides sp. Soil796]KRF11949.1 ATP-binding protein [Nocardioides sp. Soil796]
MSFDAVRAIALFDGLDDDQLRQLLDAGDEVGFGVGEELFREARPAADWWVLLEGSLTLTRHVGHEETLMGRMATPGQWAGGFQAWDPHGIYTATGRGDTAGRLLRVPADRLRGLADAWFPFGVHMISGLMNTVRSIESRTRQREALVALGTLAAGLAHEINNPASAATRAVDALAETCEELLSSLTRLAEGPITAGQFVELDTLRREIEPPPAVADPLAVADREDALSDWLAAHGVEREWEVASHLAAAGVDVAWCDRVAVVLEGGPLAAGLGWVASSLSTSALLSEVKESTRRISELVAAVRTYSQLDRASVQRMDLTEGLESTLVMLGHKLGGITVVRDYGSDVPQIEATAAELNQVWTNLIDNAVDAMEGVGTLRVSTRAQGEGVVVEIVDSGPGMPDDVQAHAFEPFFTTKDVGQGTGLGLDLSRRIVVERHGGEITIESEPGRTVFRVRLPKRPSSSPAG